MAKKLNLGGKMDVSITQQPQTYSQNNSRLRCLHGWTNRLSWIPLKIYGGWWNWESIRCPLVTVSSWRQFAKRNGTKLIHNAVKSWLLLTVDVLKLKLPKTALQQTYDEYFFTSEYFFSLSNYIFKHALFNITHFLLLKVKYEFCKLYMM